MNLLLDPIETDSGFDSELEESIGTEELRRLFTDTRSSTPNPTPRPLVMPTPVPSADLAPIPSMDQIFGQFLFSSFIFVSDTKIHGCLLLQSGKIDFLQKRHKQDLKEYTRNQRLAQARMTQGLNEKLNERRSRRSRMEMHSRQMEALKEA